MMFPKSRKSKKNRNPSAAHKRLWGKVFSVGCMACRQEGNFSFPEIHHGKDYGYNDHSFVYGLCPKHHAPSTGVDGILNRHEHTKEFAAKYGTDRELFNKCMSLIKG